MRNIFGSLAVRIGAVFLLGLLLLQAVIIGAMIWPDGQPVIFQLVSPREAADMARAVESATGARQEALIVEALNGGPLTVHLLPDFPHEDSSKSAQRAPYLARLYGSYAFLLDGRPFQVQARGDSALPSPPRSWIGNPGVVRLLVKLRTGKVLVVERAPVLLQRLFARFAIVALAAAAILLAVMLLCIQQMARPARRLAVAARQLASDIDMPDLPVQGAAEIRVLSTAFNDMKHTIRGLIDERTRMLAAIAHDLRTYLTRLRLRADFITDPDQQARAIHDLDEMGLLLDDTLIFAQEEAEQCRAPIVVQVEKEIRSFVALRQEIGDPVTCGDSTEMPLYAYCAPLALRRMLANLTDNAIRYGKQARLSIRHEQSHVKIAVEDDGPGVPADAIARLMEPFERLEPSRGRRTGGAGLGLAIVKALAKSQGGDLVLENRKGGGLTAVISLQAA